MNAKLDAALDVDRVRADIAEDRRQRAAAAAMEQHTAANHMDPADTAYLRALADLLHRVPAMYGVDSADYDRLRRIAARYAMPGDPLGEPDDEPVDA